MSAFNRVDVPLGRLEPDQRHIDPTGTAPETQPERLRRPNRNGSGDPTGTAPETQPERLRRPNRNGSGDPSGTDPATAQRRPATASAHSADGVPLSARWCLTRPYRAVIIIT